MFLEDLKKSFEGFNKGYSDVCLVCIGSNNISGDRIGPIVGQVLSKKYESENIHIFGNINNNINLKNAKKIYKNILDKYKKPYIICIDAALGDEKYIGENLVINGKMNIGSYDKEGIEIPSNISIKSVVAKYSKDHFENLINLSKVDEKQIEKLSLEIVTSLDKIFVNV